MRPETTADEEALRRIHTAAFGRAEEADLVDRLRAAGQAVISLVAEQEGEVTGHILFSPVMLEPLSDSWRALGLAPVGVLPEKQGQGIGAALVRAGLAECERLGYGGVVVLGSPGYYARFGFGSASRYGLACEYPVPERYFMALELRPGAFNGVRGLVRYRPEFAGL